MVSAYYNEFDPQKAAWLRELIRQNLITPGDVDERSIKDVPWDDLKTYKQCHFFAGIGVWSYALRQAGWPDDREVWTGSCPCQPFSAAGKREGVDDDRHLWPYFNLLISECAPGVVFGEQVASKDGLAWLDTVLDDLEEKGYAVGAGDFCAAGVGAPHIRQRLYFVAERLEHSTERKKWAFSWKSNTCGEESVTPRIPGIPIWLANSNNKGPQGLDKRRDSSQQFALGTSGVGGEQPFLPSPLNSFWSPSDWLFCRDNKWRPVESVAYQMDDGVANELGYLRNEGFAGTEGQREWYAFPLAEKQKARTGRLKGYGDAIVAPLAIEFVKAYLDISGEEKRIDE